MVKKGNWKRDPIPTKLDKMLEGNFKNIDIQTLTEKLCKNTDRTSFSESNYYFFSIPIGFLNWKLIGIIPLDYRDPSGNAIIGQLESIIRQTKYKLLIVSISIGILVLFSLMVFLSLSKSAIKKHLIPLLQQFVSFLHR